MAVPTCQELRAEVEEKRSQGRNYNRPERLPDVPKFEAEAIPLLVGVALAAVLLLRVG